MQKSAHNQRGSQAMDFQFEVGLVSAQAESEVDGLNNGGKRSCYQTKEKTVEIAS